jgi:hypothetical protein
MTSLLFRRLFLFREIHSSISSFTLGEPSFYLTKSTFQRKQFNAELKKVNALFAKK